MAKATKHKMRISGNVVEFWEFQSPIFLEGNKGGGRRKKGEKESENADEYRKQNSRKSKDKFRSLVSTNFVDGDKFITLTFRDTDLFDIRNVEHTNKEFKKFMQRLKYKFGDFKYLAVIEFQDENKRGAVHYHFMAKLPFVPYDDLAEIWGHGFIGINYMKGVDNIGAYISKYMAKDQGDPRLKGKKNYLPSKNLDKPIILYGSQVQELKKEYKSTKKEVFTDCYESEHFGQTLYDEYNLKRDVKQTKIGKGLQEKMIAEDQIQAFKKIIYKDHKSLSDQSIEIMEGLKDGSITYDRSILEEITRREKKAFLRGRDQLKLLERLLESNGGSATSREDREEQEKLVNEILRLEGIEKREKWDRWVDLQDTILS